MNIKNINYKLSNIKYLFLIIIITLIAIFITNYYDNYKKEQIYFLKKKLDNTFLKKTVKKIAVELEPRYNIVEFLVKSGDTYESIIEKLEISKKEKNLLIQTIKSEKKLKILRINQKIFFKIDKKGVPKIIELKIELDNKNEILFSRSLEEKSFTSQIIEKNLEKVITYKESIILSSLYNTAIKVGIKPNVIIDFARLYGFQIDFQRDIWKNDSFQIIYEEFKNFKGEVVETGEIIYANLNLQEKDYQLYKFEYEENKIDYFDEEGKSVRKTLMKTPINGARLSSPFGKRKHPILGFNKMHTGTDFAAPTGTPIMASGDGVVTRAQWCGGGGNCVKIKHTSVSNNLCSYVKIWTGIKRS